MNAGLLLALIAATIWAALLVVRNGFWLARERDDRDQPPPPANWPSVVAVVPARDEAAVVARAVASLIAQEYPGSFRVILVDDASSDGTGAIALATAGASDRLTVVAGQPLPAGWTGKLWAVAQGIDQAGTTDFLLLTDADIAHAPDMLRTLVARAVYGRLVLASLMARLNCTSLAERMLIPAFVFFFQLLYPFAAVNRPARRLAAAAGGCMLVDRAALVRAGGIAALRDALIDDCALGAAMKRQGPIWLGLTDRAVSIRPYPHFADVAAMIARSAYAQLRYSPVLLAGTLAGLVLVYAVPPLFALFGAGLTQITGALTWAMMTLAFQPMLRFYRRSPLWGLALPAIAAFYAGCTLLSAVQNWRGRGGLWKGRSQAMVGR